ncbi:MAG: glycosyltransferase family 2 protein, partial [Candidatus Staskawiczbacteria bacterium]|nr:glycosyltransferase family 2 protein [Candidatus Staskawiczbacteria bacterium]
MEKSEYLDISKAGDIKNRKERWLYRFFEMIPAGLSLGTLLGVLVFSWLFPSAVAIFIICFCFYYLFRIFYFSLHQTVGYFRVKANMKKNWLHELKKQKSWKDIYHVIILPTYKESEGIIEETIRSIIKSDYPKEKLIVVLAVEERAGDVFEETAREIVKKYSSRFFKFFVSVHPENIAGEIGGKGSNTAHAGKEAKKLIDELKSPYKNILVSTFDIDTKVFEQYFACLTWHY